MKKFLKRLSAVTLAVMTVAMAFAGSSLAAFGGFGSGFGTDVTVSSGSSFGFGSSTNSGFGFGFGSNTSTNTNANTNTNTQEAAKNYGEIVNVKNNVNFRSKASNSASKVSGCSTLPKGAKVEILGISGDWYKLSYNGYTGYVKKDYVEPTSSGSSTGSSSTGSSTGNYGKIVNVNSNVNFRSKASSSASKVDGCPILNKDAVVEILGTSGSWYKLSYNGYVGYVKKSYVEKTEAPAIDNTGSSTGSSSTGTNSSTGFGGFGSNTSTSTGFGGAFGSNTNSGFGGFGSNTGSSNTGSTSGTTTMGPSISATKAILSSSDKTKVAAMSSNYAAALKKNSDTNGWIFVPGTNVDYPVMYRSDLNYYNNHTIDHKKADRGSIYSYTSAMPSCGITTITGHNSRSSGTMFHELHDWQNALKKNKNGNRIAFIQFPGTKYTQWEVFAMYETKNNSDAKTQMRINILQHTVNTTGEAKQAWIDHQIGKSEVKFGTTATPNDQIIVLMTCGDRYEKVSYARLYFFLKGVA